MFINDGRYRVLYRAIAIGAVCLFLVNDSAFAFASEKSALAPPLATKYPCEIVRNNDGSYEVVANNDIQEPFRGRWAFMDVSHLIAQMLIFTGKHDLQNPKDILIPLIKKHIKNRGGEAETLLKRFNIDGIEEVREGQIITGFSLPVTKRGLPSYKLIYNLQSDGTSIQMRDGKNVYVKVEYLTSPVIKAEYNSGESFGLEIIRLYEEGVFDNPSERTVRFIRLNTWEPIELARFLESAICRICSDSIPKAKRISHPEKAGGTHFDTNLLIDINLVYKIPDSPQVEKSIMLAYQRLRGIVLGFTLIRKPDDSLWIIQESVPSLKVVLEKIIEEGDVDGATNLLKKFFLLNIELFKRGVVNWDASLQNYGVRQNGDVRLLDIGGLVTTEEFLSNAEQKIEDSYLSYLWMKLRQDTPSGLRGFHDIASEMGFSNGSTIYELVKRHANQREKGHIERFVPPVFRKELADFITTETKKRFYNKQTNLLPESELFRAADSQDVIGRTQAQPRPRGLAAKLQDNRLTQNKWIIASIGKVIYPILKLTEEGNLQNPETLARDHVRKHFAAMGRLGSAAPSTLDRFDIDAIKEVRDGEKITGFSLPLKKRGRPAYRLIYSLQDRGSDTAISIKDGDTVYVGIEGIADLSLPSYTEETLAALEAAGGSQKKAAGILKVSPSLVSARVIKIRKSASEINDTATLERLDRALSSLPSFMEETIKALEATGGNQTEAGRILNISRQTVWERIKGIRKAAYKRGDTATLERLNNIHSLHERNPLLYNSWMETLSPESECIHAVNLRDMINYMSSEYGPVIASPPKADEAISKTGLLRSPLRGSLAMTEEAQPNTQPLIVALGTNWIKGYEREKDGRTFSYLQGGDLNELIISTKNYCEKKGIPFIVDDDDKLPDRISAEKTKAGLSGAKVVVLAGKDVVVSDKFADLRNDEKNTVVGVDNHELTTDSYIRLMEMLTIVLKLSTGFEVPQDATAIKIVKDGTLHIYILTPPAQLMPYEQQKPIYEVQRNA